MIRAPRLELSSFSLGKSVWPTATPTPSPTQDERRPSKKPRAVAVELVEVTVNGTPVRLQPLERAILRRLYADHGKTVPVLTLAQVPSGFNSTTVTKAMAVVGKLRQTFKEHNLSTIVIERVLEPSGYRLIGVETFSDDII